MPTNLQKKFRNLVGMGYTASTILGMFGEKSKKASKFLSNAFKYGYAAPTILSSLLKDEEGAQHYVTHEQKTAAIQKKKALQGIGLAAGAAALAATGIGALARGGLGALSKGLLAGEAVAEAAKESSPLTSSQKEVAEALPQMPQSTTEAISIPSQEKSTQDYLKSKTHSSYPQLSMFIEKHLQSGKSPQETSEIIEKSRTLFPIAKRAQMETGLTLPELVEQIYSKSSISSSKEDALHNTSVMINLMKGLRNK